MFIMLYLDNAATTRKKPPSVYAEMLRYLLFSGGNAGRGSNKLSLSGVRRIISAQEAAAELFGVEDESHIIFTQNATYALNIAILGTLSPQEHMVVTAMDHNSVLRPAYLHGKFSVAPADKYGTVSPLAVRKSLNKDTALIAATHVSNVCGTIQPVIEFAKTAHNNNAVFLLDASQSAGSIPVSMDKIRADIIACPGHKGLMGPMGTGILCINNPDKLRAVIVGGTGSESESIKQPESMPDKFHSGTMNIPAIAGLCEGIRFVLREGVENIGIHEKALADEFRSNLLNMRNIDIFGRADSGITAFNMKGRDSAEFAALLGNDIIIRAGYHCAPLAHKALGTENSGLVRVSFGYYNTKADVRKITDAVYKAVKSAEI